MIDKRIYEKLKEIARNRSKIHYNELATLFGLPFETSDDRNKLYQKLGDISAFEVENGRPMLSAVVVHEPSFDKLQMPGEGFFKLAIELGRWDGKGKKEKFFYDEIKKVWDYWSKKH